MRLWAAGGRGARLHETEQECPRVSGQVQGSPPRGVWALGVGGGAWAGCWGGGAGEGGGDKSRQRKEQWGGGTVRMALRVKEGTQRSKLPIRDPGGAGLKRGWRKGSDGEKRGWVPPS